MKEIPLSLAPGEPVRNMQQQARFGRTRRFWTLPCESRSRRLRSAVRWSAATASSAVIVVALLPAVAAAHPFHVSLAEAEYDAPRRTLKVALRVHPADLEAALRRQAGRRIVLESSPDADEQIVAYLGRAFIAKTADGQTAGLRWVGKEVSVKHAWLYFEIALSRGLQGVEFANRLFFELHPDQLNTINFRDGPRRATLHFTRTEPTRRLEGGAGRGERGELRAESTE